MPNYYTTANNTTTAWSMWTNDNSTSTADNAWDHWITYDLGTSAKNIIYRAPAPKPKPLTAAEQERRQRLNAETQKRMESQRIAKERAEKLLVSCLDKEQREDLEVHSRFRILVGSNWYSIGRGHAGNVYLLDKEGDRPTVRYCAHPIDSVPDADAMLAQKLLLETDEAAFVQIANATMIRG